MGSEIISTVERRRRWPPEEKLRIMSEALEQGASVSGVADRNGLRRSQLHQWLKLAREDRLPGISLSPKRTAAFVPVQIEAPAKPTDRPPPPVPIADTRSATSARGRRAAMIEVVLTNGRIVKVDETIDPDAFARLLVVLDTGAGRDGGGS
jgi:transposase